MIAENDHWRFSIEDYANALALLQMETVAQNEMANTCKMTANCGQFLMTGLIKPLNRSYGFAIFDLQFRCSIINHRYWYR